MEFLTELKELGPTVVVVGLFLWYLVRRDKSVQETAREGHAAAKGLAVNIGELKTAIQDLHTEIRVNAQHAEQRRRSE